MSILNDQVAIITGATGSIGKAIALRFAKEKAKLILSSSSQNCIELAKSMQEKGYSAEGIPCNFESIDSIINLVTLSFEKWGKINILVNAVGITKDQLAIQIKESIWDQILNINLRGSFFACQSALKFMMKERQGKIINISSIVGLIGNIGQSHYAASKSALIGMSKSLAKEFASRNIQINCVVPGFIESQMLEKIPKERLEQYKASIPLKRFGKPEEIANIVTFLASNESNYITGQKFIIDGGLTMY